MDGRENPRAERRLGREGAARGVHRIHAEHRDAQRARGGRLHFRRYPRACGRHIETEATDRTLPPARHPESRREDTRTITCGVVILRRTSDEIALSSPPRFALRNRPLTQYDDASLTGACHG